MKRKLTAVFILFFFMLSAQQRPVYKLSIEKPFSYSYAHHRYMNFLTGRYVNGFQIGWIFDHKNKNTKWAKAYNFPENGLIFTYQNFNHQILGEVFGLFYHYTFFLLPRKYASNLLLQIGQGVAYNTHPYDKAVNPKNVIFSTHLLFSLYFSLKYRYRLNKLPLETEAGLSIYHYSNGSYKHPNNGLNLPGMNISLIYTLSPTRRDTLVQSGKIHFVPQHSWSVFFKTTLNMPDVPGIKMRPGYLFGMEHTWRPGYKNIFYAGMEIMINYALKNYLQYEEAAYGLYKGDIPDFKRMAVTLGHQLYLNKMNLVTGIGIYFYNPSKKEAPWYFRAGCRYRISKKWQLSAVLKTHYFTAEEMDFGIHYNFNF